MEGWNWPGDVNPSGGVCGSPMFSQASEKRCKVMPLEAHQGFTRRNCLSASMLTSLPAVQRFGVKMVEPRKDSILFRCSRVTGYLGLLTRRGSFSLRPIYIVYRCTGNQPPKKFSLSPPFVWGASPPNMVNPKKSPPFFVWWVISTNPWVSSALQDIFEVVSPNAVRSLWKRPWNLQASRGL